MGFKPSTNAEQLGALAQNLQTSLKSTHSQSKTTKSLPTGALKGKTSNLNLSGVTMVNSAVNGDFSDSVNGWASVGATLNVTNHILSVVGDGTSIYNLTQKADFINPIVGDKVFFYSRFRVTNSSAISLTARSVDGNGNNDYTISTPVQDEWYENYKLLNSGGGLTDYRLYAAYSDSATANGKVMEVDGNAGVFAINLTQSGLITLANYLGYTTDAEISEWMADNVRNGYFEGMKSVENPVVRTEDELGDETTQIAFTDTTLRMVPNGTKDTINEVDGELVLTRRAWLEQIDLSVFNILVTNNNGRDMYRKESYPFQVTPNPWVTILDKAHIMVSTLRGIIPQKNGWAEAPTSGGWAVRSTPIGIDIVIPTGENLATYFGDVYLLHSITPQTINLTQQGLVSGQLQSFENGTCYIESDSFQAPVTFDVPVNQASRIDGAIDGNIANAKALASLQEIVDTHIAGI